MGSRSKEGGKKKDFGESLGQKSAGKGSELEKTRILKDSKKNGTQSRFEAEASNDCSAEGAPNAWGTSVRSFARRVWGKGNRKKGGGFPNEHELCPQQRERKKKGPIKPGVVVPRTKKDAGHWCSERSADILQKTKKGKKSANLSRSLGEESSLESNEREFQKGDPFRKSKLSGEIILKGGKPPRS